jgi:hypothetical protein
LWLVPAGASEWRHDKHTISGVDQYQKAIQSPDLQLIAGSRAT